MTPLTCAGLFLRVADRRRAVCAQVRSYAHVPAVPSAWRKTRRPVWASQSRTDCISGLTLRSAFRSARPASGPSSMSAVSFARNGLAAKTSSENRAYRIGRPAASLKSASSSLPVTASLAMSKVCPPKRSGSAKTGSTNLPMSSTASSGQRCAQAESDAETEWRARFCGHGILSIRCGTRA